LKEGSLVRRRSLLPLAVLLIGPLAMSSIAVAADRRVAPQRGRAASLAEPLHASANGPTADALTRALRAGRIDRATYALERARALFDPAGVRARYGDVAAPAGREATMVLRDLLAVYDRLTPAEKTLATQIAARPTDGVDDDLGDGYTTTEATPYCTTGACFHYVTTTEDAPPLTDTDGDTVPDQVESAATEFATVWNTEITSFGFRAPKSDLTSTNHGPDGNLDIYLAQIGDAGLYGYCFTDDPNAFSGTYAYFDLSSYCVIDDDFVELGGLTAMQVTLAHEFFHASQFAYDAVEDRWFMESTAVWMEERVFDAIDDNVQYLGSGPLGRPRVPLDSNNSTFGIYGDWIFHEFVSERFAAGGVEDVAVVREAWERADGSASGPDKYSVKAIDLALKAVHDTSFREVFADLGMYNDVPAKFYEEAQTLRYPVPPLSDRFRITKRNGGAADTLRLKHLANAYIAFVPGRGVRGGAKLRISVDLPPYRTGPEASVVTVSRTGAVRYREFRLNSGGDGVVRVPFGRRTIVTADLVLTNASTRTRCWTDRRGRYACWGTPTDDNLKYAFDATLLN
jgi:hypothetical protein